MIHLVKNSYDGINGLSVLTYANRAIKNSNATEESALSFFDNGCNLSGVLTVQGQLQEKQKNEIRQSWQQAYKNGGQGLAVLQGNMEYQPIQINAKDAQMIESRQYNVTDIARFFGINPVLLGDLTNATYSTLEAVQNEFLLHTLQPYITMVENEFNRKLLKPSEKDLTIILETNEILRIDKSAQASYYSTMLTNGILSINEIRKELGYNPIEDGDKHIIPFTDINQNTLENNNTDTEETEDEESI
jgi:HK97 family phage portal protein